MSGEVQEQFGQDPNERVWPVFAIEFWDGARWVEHGRARSRRTTKFWDGDTETDHDAAAYASAVQEAQYMAGLIEGSDVANAGTGVPTRIVRYDRASDAT